MTGSSSIKAGIFMQKSFKSGGRDCWGRTPSGFPLLQCGKFGGHANLDQPCPGADLSSSTRHPRRQAQAPREQGAGVAAARRERGHGTLVRTRSK